MVFGVSIPRAGYAEAVREGYLWHEFGDSHLLLGGVKAQALHGETGGR